ncbi:MAG: group II intron maturase-specific domain-containing protein [Gammaproteobacteria bacterium]
MDELDREWERRALAFCRFADDCNLFVGSQKAAERVMDSISRFIEQRLTLKVNREQSQAARSDTVKFLGFTIVQGTVAIAHKALQSAMANVKELTPRGTQLTLETTLATINQWYVGWSSYFSVTQYPSQLHKIEAPIRRRLRSRLIDQQKSRRNLYRKLVKRGISRRQAANAVFSNRQRWALSNTFAVTKAYPNRWFIQDLGQAMRSDQTLPHWFDLARWIRLP